MNKKIKCPECNKMKPVEIVENNEIRDGFLPTQWNTEICEDCWLGLMNESLENE